MDLNLSILVGKDKGKSFKLKPDKEYIVGRHSKNEIKIKDENISRKHFKIQMKANRYFITDLYSKNGTFVGGKDLIPGVETEVGEGVPIIIGMTILGLGSISDSSLKQFLDSAGFDGEMSDKEEAIEQKRIIAIKKNMEFIYYVNNSIMDSKDKEEILEILLDSIFNLFKRIDRCVIISVDNKTGEINNIIYRSRKPISDPEKIYNRELVEQALIMNKPVMIKDSNNVEDEDERITESLQLMKIRSALCVPITSYHGVRGAIYVDSLERPSGFRVSDVALLKNISGRAALAMDSISSQMS